MVKFVHTADWQLGMTRHFLSGDAQARYSEARLDVVRKIAELVRSEGCAFVVVSGDVFESNQLDRRVVVRALDTLRLFDVPVYLLPGNHDPVNPGSVYRSLTFKQNLPQGVILLDSFAPQRVPGVDVEVVGAPWDSKQPLEDLVARACAGLHNDDKTMRVLVGHGAVDRGNPNPYDPALIGVDAAEAAIVAGLIQYVALGDRHSTTEVGSTGRLWYSGTPLVTDYDEVEPNKVLLVELEPSSIRVERREVGTWKFLRRSFQVNNLEEVDSVWQWLDDTPTKQSTVVKLSFTGTLSLADKARLDSTLEHFSDLFAALETWQRHTELLVRPDQSDLVELGLSGFAAEAVRDLAVIAGSVGADAEVAQDALGLLYRLVRSDR